MSSMVLRSRTRRYINKVTIKAKLKIALKQKLKISLLKQIWIEQTIGT